jgi:membrane protein implicated in regulation of membrane protease activity
MRDWLRDRGLGVLFVSVFLVTWIGQLVFEWLEFANAAADHGLKAVFWSEAFWVAFWQSTLENWQSEFLQLSAFTIACAYLVYKGSSESSDGQERMEAKLDVLLEREGIDPEEVEATLPAKFRRR